MSERSKKVDPSPATVKANTSPKAKGDLFEFGKNIDHLFNVSMTNPLPKAEALANSIPPNRVCSEAATPFVQRLVLRASD